ncbi:3-beta hydroxysteroid-dehydrogenase/ decarboxylase isoform 2, partial [Tanacetum coccineum]
MNTVHLVLYVVPTGRVVVPTGRYVVPAGKVIIIASLGRLSLVPTGRILSPGSKDLSRVGSNKLLVPSLVSAARAGKSKFIIGDGTNMYDFTYVENVAHAHICAERALASDESALKRAASE